MTEQRAIGVVRDYYDLVKMMRTRAKELRITRETIDLVSGMQTGYAAKLMSIPPARGLGRVSLGPMLAALGMKLVGVEDPEALAMYSKQFREHPHAELADGKFDLIEIHLSRKKLMENAKRGGKKRAEKLSRKKRQTIAARAGRQSGRKRRQLGILRRTASERMKKIHAQRAKDRLAKQEILALPTSASALPATPIELCASSPRSRLAND